MPPSLPWTPWPAENWFFPNSPKAPTNSIQTGKHGVHSRCVLLSSQGGWLVSLEGPSPLPRTHTLPSRTCESELWTEISLPSGHQMIDWWWYTCTTLVYESLIFFPQTWWSSFWCVQKEIKESTFSLQIPLLILTSISSLNNPENSEMKIRENMKLTCWKIIIIIIISYTLNNFITHITIL